MRVDQVLIAVPTRGAIKAQTISQLDRIRELNPALTSPAYAPGHLSVFETRNDVGQFLLSDPEQMDWQAVIMVDDDIVPPWNMLGLVDYLEVLGDFGIVGAAYPVFQPKICPLPMPAAYTYLPEQETWRYVNDSWLQSEIVECDAVGFGCVAIHRRVFETLKWPWFEPEYGPLGAISDDLAFCRRARSAGIKVACDFSRVCEHHSTVQLLALSEGIFAVIDDSVEGEARRGRELLYRRNGMTLPAEPDEREHRMNLSRSVGGTVIESPVSRQLKVPELSLRGPEDAWVLQDLLEHPDSWMPPPGYQPLTILDLGCHGGFSTALLAANFPQARLVGVDLDGGNVEQANRNLTGLEADVRELAIAGETGMRSYDPEALSNCYALTANGDGGRMVATSTLGDLIRATGFDRIDFLKVDVEGAEEEVFSTDDWAEYVRCLQVELHGDGESVRARLAGLGFTVVDRANGLLAHQELAD